MREIKFRAFYQGKMYKVNLIDWDTGVLELEIGENDAWEVKIFDVELMQFTGLKDENGKEVYEGDLVRTNDTNWSDLYGNVSVVEWDEFTAGFHRRLDLEGRRFDRCIDTIEVLGNIHETPNLLI